LEQRWLWIGVLVVGIPAVSAPARAETGFELGARLGIGMPLGKASEDGADMTEIVSAQFPLWVDLGIRADRVMFGAYFQYGPGLLGSDIDDECEAIEENAEAANPDTDLGCHVRDIRLGLQLQYHFGRPRKPDPWIGVGAGYEWLTIGISGEDDDEDFSADVGVRGFEFLNLQAGIDLPLNDAIGLGPFLAFTVARYDTLTVDCSGDCGDLDDDSQDLDEKALHHWLMLGVHLSLLP
jgi:hypothetical protein